VKDEYLLVWTTTPWTIPANICVAVNKDFDYSLVEWTTGDLFWVAKDLVEEVFAHDRPVHKVIKTVKGKELVGLHYQGPFDDLPAVSEVAKNYPEKFHTVIATDELILPISLTEGTGMIHTAVSAGVEDFKLGKKYGLPMIPVIADNADYLPGLGFLSGKNAKKNPKIILDYLREKDFVFKTHHYKHRYPACWRCKSELVWKVEDEWYIAMDRVGKKIEDGRWKMEDKTLRQRMIEVAKKIKWMPEFGLERELDWLKNMNDWLISKKNRYWGLALPIYECRGCGGFEVIGSKEELEKRAVSGWKEFEGHSPHKPFIDEVKIKCQNCGKTVSRLNDVGNPWLDAGIVAYSTISEDNQGQPLYLKDKKKWRSWFPVDLITESFPGQFKNWFYAQIAMSTVMENTPPFKRVLGFATLVGEDGRPMHKSWGNAIEFNEGADKIGVDVMRWMFSRHSPADNLLFGYKRADEVRRQFYLMLWNVYKFFVEYANLDKFKA
ncbi:MAG: class I tRNA ligase family protein, partial [Candidatus Roizmanbacteria bacterium]|nr:class I tRNA ligase family protein [Candidatus Roizmanbacteria bacterium]